MTNLQRTRRLATAFKRIEAAEDKLAQARKAFDAEFGQWAAGRRIDRDTAREQLVSTGYLEKRRSQS